MQKIIVLTKSCVVTYEIDNKARRKLKPIADEFGLSIEEFVTCFTSGTLPGQLQRNSRNRDAWKLDRKLAGSITQLIAKENPEAFARIERATSLAAESPAEFVWGAIGSWITCCEDDMLLSPKTAKPIADLLHFTLDRYVVSRKLLKK